VIRALRVLALGGLLAAMLPARASAEWQFAPFAGFSFLGDTNLNVVKMGDRHWNIGGTVRLLGAGPLGLEALFVYVPNYIVSTEGEVLTPFARQSSPVTESRSMALMGNVVLTTPRRWNQYGLRPYVSGGFGLLHAYHNDALFPARINVPGYNVGGGAVGFLSDRAGVRFDLRYLRTAPPGRAPTLEVPTSDGERVRVRYWTGSIGVVFKY
jgi:hypothetical protein